MARSDNIILIVIFIIASLVWLGYTFYATKEAEDGDRKGPFKKRKLKPLMNVVNQNCTFFISDGSGPQTGGPKMNGQPASDKQVVDENIPCTVDSSPEETNLCKATCNTYARGTICQNSKIDPKTCISTTPFPLPPSTIQ